MKIMEAINFLKLSLDKNHTVVHPVSLLRLQPKDTVFVTLYQHMKKKETKKTTTPKTKKY